MHRVITALVILVGAAIEAYAFAPPGMGSIVVRPVLPVASNANVRPRTAHSHDHDVVKKTASPTLLSMQQGEEENDSVGGLSTPLDRPVLAAVDIAALIGFAAVGKASHSADGSLDVGAVLATAGPFLSAWLLTSPLTGVYTSDSDDGNVVSESFIKTAKGWIVAVPLGICLRGLIKGYIPPVSFAVVTMIATLVILGGARLLFTIAEDVFVEMVN